MALVVRYDQQYDFFTEFDTVTGNKRRYRFGDNAEVPTKATAPELLDIKITDYCPFGCAFCAPADTVISMADGTTKPISEIVVGDRVVALQEGVGFTVDDVGVIYERDYVGELIKIELDNGHTLRLTPNHEVFTQRGWVNAGDLLETDELKGL